jgi:dTDP-4-dehydrorhamnose reductase
MNILITGAGGFLGWHIARDLARDHSVHAIARHHSPVISGVRWIPFDLASNSGLERIFGSVRPEVVIHAAALTSVAYCEAHRKETVQVNIKATERIAEQCEKNDVYLIYASTDLVFDGFRGNYAEHDQTNPISFYARSKRVGEEIVQSNVSKHTVVRFSLLYGSPAPYSRSFLGWMEEGFRHGKEVTLFTDQFRTPLYAGDAVFIIRKLIERLTAPPLLKLIHCGGPERVSRVEFGAVFCKVFGYDTKLIREITMAEKGEVTNDVKDASLAIDRARTFLGFSPHGIEAGLERIKISPLSGIE